MSTERVFTDEALEKLRLRVFPRVPWTAEGPVRRRYRVRAARADQTAAEALEALAAAEGFIAPGRHALTGDGGACLAAYRRGDEADTLVFGTGTDAFWCDLALGQPDGEGWQTLIVRSERAENLVALAHAAWAVRFRRA